MKQPCAAILNAMNNRSNKLYLTLLGAERSATK